MQPYSEVGNWWQELLLVLPPLHPSLCPRTSSCTVQNSYIAGEQQNHHLLASRAPFRMPLPVVNLEPPQRQLAADIGGTLQHLAQHFPRRYKHWVGQILLQSYFFCREKLARKIIMNEKLASIFYYLLLVE